MMPSSHHDASHCEGRRGRLAVLCRQVVILGGLAGLLAASWPAITAAQGRARNRYFPLDQNAPPGTAARWAAVQRGFQPVLQPVRIDIPSGGHVTYYTSTAGDQVDTDGTAIVGLQVGSLYRLKISDIPDFVGAELYPTIELIDRLHPPRGRELEFPVPIALTAEEISLALQGRMVTKVIYLEQPDKAAPNRGTDAARSRIARSSENVIALADEAGRPMAIVRLGGREPDAGAAHSGFYGIGAPVLVLQQANLPPKATQP